MLFRSVSQAVQAGLGEVPASARDVVLARAARLGGPARAVLDVAALIGTRADLALLEQVTGCSPAVVDDLQSALDPRPDCIFVDAQAAGDFVHRVRAVELHEARIGAPAAHYAALWGSSVRLAIIRATSESRHRSARPMRTGRIGHVPLLSLFRIVFAGIFSRCARSLISISRSSMGVRPRTEQET